MAVNTIPIYSSKGQVNYSATITAANTAKDGTGTVATIFRFFTWCFHNYSALKISSAFSSTTG